MSLPQIVHFFDVQEMVRMLNLVRSCVVSVGFLTLASVSPVTAVMAPPALLAKPALGTMVDARVNLKDSFARATAARAGMEKSGRTAAQRQVAALAARLQALKRSMPALEVKVSNLTGGPESVINQAGALTAAAPGRASEEIVRQFLGEQGDLYGLSAADLGDLVALGDSPGGTSGLRMLRMEQQIDGLPVFQSETRFLLDRDGRLVKSVGLMVPHARSLAPELKSAKLIAPEEAVVRLLAADGRTASAASFKVAGEEKDGRLQLAETDDFVAGPVTARKVLFPLAPGMLVPAWSLVVFTTGDQDYY